MRGYIVRRFLLFIPTFLVVTMTVFGIMRLIPGNIIDLMVSDAVGSVGPGGGKIDRASIERSLGLDVPVYVQYGRWMADMFTHGSLGKSLWKGSSVTDDIVQRLPITLELGLMGILTGLCISLPIGIYSAIRQDTWGDYVGRTFAIFCIAVPSFWLATMVMVVPSLLWDWSPSMKYIPFVENPGGNLRMFIIPAVILGMELSGTTMRMVRTMVLEVMRQDYVRTAWAKGLSERVIVLRHTLKSALIPVVTLVGLQLPTLIGGSVILEQVFNLPGVGRMLVEAITTRDYIVISGVNVFLVSFVLLLNLGVDLAYGFLDPRVHYR